MCLSSIQNKNKKVMLPCNKEGPIICDPTAANEALCGKINFDYEQNIKVKICQKIK